MEEEKLEFRRPVRRSCNGQVRDSESCTGLQRVGLEWRGRIEGHYTVKMSGMQNLTEK